MAKDTSAHSNGAAEQRVTERRGETRTIEGRGAPAPAAFDRPPQSGLLDPNLALLPYLEMSRALLRAHHNVLAMVEANRMLSDNMRAILRRQQDLAFELAEQALADKSGAPGEGLGRERAFERAAEAVKEIGQAVIDAQLSALQTLHVKAFEAAETGRPERSGGPARD